MVIPNADAFCFSHNTDWELYSLIGLQYALLWRVFSLQ
jgi:hypothetical protein